jgi:hypothetical protein
MNYLRFRQSSIISILHVTNKIQLKFSTEQRKNFFRPGRHVPNDQAD